MEKLQEKRKELLKSLRTNKPLLASSISEIRSKCGKPNCRCARGHKHLSHIITRRENGKTKTTYVPVDLVPEVKKWIAEYKRIKDLLHELTILGENIIKNHVQEKRRSYEKK